MLQLLQYAKPLTTGHSVGRRPGMRSPVLGLMGAMAFAVTSRGWVPASNWT